MKNIVVYGEDGFTLWFLTKKIKEFLNEVKDKSTPENCLIMYRPSLGRGPSCYGEFDAIVVAEKIAYLIESKWARRTRPYNLSNVQLDRHKILKWYYDNVKQENEVMSNEAWDIFRDNEKEQFENSFGKGIPGSNSLLSENIRYILDTFKTRKIRQLKNIAVLFVSDSKYENSNINKPNGTEFTIIKKIILENESGYIELQ
jgi:hypothetical protein